MKVSFQEIQKIFPTFFTPQYNGKLKNPKLIKIILETLNKETLSSTEILNKIKDIELFKRVELNRSNIMRIKKIAEDRNLIKKIDVLPETKIVKYKFKKILPVSKYNFAPYVRKGQKVAPPDSKFKIVFMMPQGKTTKIPSKFQGVQFYKTEKEAKRALDERNQLNFTPTKDEVKKRNK